MTRASLARLPACAGALALILFTSSSHARPEGAEHHVEASTSPVQTCDALTGGDAQHEANERWRKGRVSVRAAEGDSWEVWVRGLRATAPTTTALRGLDVVSVRDDDGQPVARVHLSPRLARLCGSRTAELRVDDNVGHGQRVLAIAPRGMLIARDSRLMFVPSGNASPPAFDVVYQSTFRVAPPPGGQFYPGAIRGGLGAFRQH